jgi:putative ABC transport system permease protein
LFVGVAILVISYITLYHNPLPPHIHYQLGQIAVFTMFVGATLLIPSTVGVWERAARPWIRRLYGSEGQLGSRNTQRNESRTALTVAALMIGIAMILSIRGMTSAFEHDIRNWIEVYIGGDLYAYSALPVPYDLGPRLEAVEGVAAVTPMRYFDVTLLRPGGDAQVLTFMAIDPSSHRRVTSFVFTSSQVDPDRVLDRLAAGDAVFISSVLAEKYELKQGDTIRLETRRGERDFEVAAVVMDVYNQGLIVEGSWKDMRRYFGLNDVNGFLLKIQPGYAVDEVQARLERLYGERRHLTIASNQALKSRVLELTAQSFSMFDVLAMIGMIVAALGVVNTLTMSVLERTQEIGMLRSLGMTRRQVGKMILAEAGMMGLIGGAFGLVFGLLLSHLLLWALNAIQGYALTYVLPTEGILVSLFIALVVSQLAALWPARRAAGIRIIEAIQFE